MYFAVSDPDNIERLSHLADGGAYPAVRPEVVAATEVTRPDRGVLEAFPRLTRAMLAKVAGNEAESRTLAALRDALLPKLVSGEIRVKDAEKFVEAVKQHQPQVVGMSAMLTTTMRAMGHTIKALEESGLREQVKIMVGGAPVDGEFAKRIGADGYGSNAPAGSELAKKFVGAA